MKLEERLISYEPLWGQWFIGEPIYVTSNTCVYTLHRQRNTEELIAVVKLVFVPTAGDNNAEELSEALREINIMDKLAECGNIVSIKDDAAYKVYDKNGNLIGYDTLIRMDKLECLADLIREDIVFNEDEILKIGEDVCNGLSYAHKYGYLHRDVKPGNIYKTASGTYQLGDLGVTRKSALPDELMTIVGTTIYMAPEVALGNAYDARADLYSLGVVLYQLLNENHLPMTNENSTYEERQNAVIRRIKGMSLPKLSRGSKKLEKCLLKACHHDPLKRYQSADEFSSAIADIHKNKNHRRQAIISGTVSLATGLLLGVFVISSAFGSISNFLKINDSTIEFSCGNSKYELIKSDVTWEEARKYCEDRGGHLVTINSDDEKQEIQRILVDNNMEVIWIGATKLYTGHSFEWITGEDFLCFARWGMNESSIKGFYLMLRNTNQEGWTWVSAEEGKISEYSLGDVGFICEWDDDKNEL